MPTAARENLPHVLRERAGDGTIRPDQVMDAVLYHPTLGYYARNAERAGRGGDFLTSPEMSPLFGACVAEWLEIVWREVGPGPFHYVEVGAGKGTLAASVLAACTPGLRRDLRLHLVERGVAPRTLLADKFRHESARIYQDVAEIPATFPRGAFVANELFDNLPMRRLMMADGWKEIRLTVKGRGIREVLEPAPLELVEAARAAGLRLSEGQTTEACLGAVPLLESVLGRLGVGGLLVFDYGGEAEEVSGEAAPHGTVSAYRGHTESSDLYASLGEQDITADVNFTPLRETAERLGFSPARLTTQARFLLDHGLAEKLTRKLAAEQDELEKLRLGQTAKQLYHPEAMGEAFRVLSAIKRH